MKWILEHLQECIPRRDKPRHAGIEVLMAKIEEELSVEIAEAKPGEEVKVPVTKQFRKMGYVCWP